MQCGAVLAKFEEALHVEGNFDGTDAHWYNKGNKLGNLLRFEEAKDCYDKAISLDSKYVKAWYRKGHTLLSLEKHLEAYDCFNKVLEKETENKKQGGKEEWAAASGFCCMLCYLYSHNNLTLENKITEEIVNPANRWIQRIHDYLLENKMIEEFSDITEFAMYCLENMNSILDKLEPPEVVHFRVKQFSLTLKSMN